MSKICLHCYIEGRVQGVYYRDTTKKKAKELGVTGYIKNLSDGRVEAIICGEQEKVEELREWLWDGPANCDVTDVTVEESAWQKYDDFEVR